MSALLELAARCEAAEGADGELDMLIWAALNGVTDITFPTEGHPMTPGRGGRVEGRDAAGLYVLLGFIDPGQVQRNWSPYGGEDCYPKVTASLDAAMTLVPEGWIVTLDVFPEEGSEALLRDDRVNPVRLSNQEAKAATPALALVAAALRARSAA